MTDGEADKALWNPIEPHTGLFTNTTSTHDSSWVDKTPSDIIADINALIEQLCQGLQAAPDCILIPHHYIYPAPVRFRVTGKRGRRGSALERERIRQASGGAVRRSVFERELK